MWKECDTELPEGFQGVRNRFMPFLLDPENTEIKKWYRGYYAAIKVLDDCIGKILSTLEEEGLLDNTLIVFTSDHGDNLGSHRQYGKSLPYEEAISIPFLVRYPRKVSGGTRTDALLSPVDMMPTMLALAGIPCPEVDGMDVSGAAMGKDPNLQDALLLMRPVWLGTNWITNGSEPWRGVRTKRYTYARTSDDLKPWVLFDNENDPWQVSNLVDDPAYEELIKELNSKTDELLERAGDPENPLFFSNLIQQEREQQGQPDRRQDLFPVYTRPGSGFNRYFP
jgi:arylsulfatase A-like enzyme